MAETKVTWKVKKTEHKGYGVYRNGILQKTFASKIDAERYVKGARAERRRITTMLRSRMRKAGFTKGKR